MSFLGPSALKSLLSSSNIITSEDGANLYNVKRVEQAAYALSLGNEAYRTDNKDRKIEILDDKNKNIEINPGQFTLLMTDEYVSIPNDKLAFISIKAKQKLKGLVNVSGFHVDPGFEGKLLFSVYNAGPSTITLETKKPYFLIWFANLEEAATGNDIYNEINNHHQGQKSIPLEYIDALKRGEIASPNVLLERINETRDSLLRVIWIAGIISGVCLTLAIKSCLDLNSYKDGYEKGKKEKSIDEEIKLKSTEYLSDSLSLQKIDSLIDKKINKKNALDKK
jgi:dCTP deaminase